MCRASAPAALLPLLLLLLLLLLSAPAAAIGDCDAGDTCSYSFAVPSAPGGSFTLALRGLCKADGDYRLDDGLGHVYSAQICGTAREPCLPKGWLNEYEYGRVVQKWGGAPSCNDTGAGAECVEESTGLPVCCTASCQVVAVRQPTASLIDPRDASKGFELFYFGETPTLSDPAVCDLDANGAPFPRTTHMQFLCDWSADGYANFFAVSQNATDDCDYTLKFKTKAACVGSPPLSGGWWFDIVVLTAGAAYYLLFSALNLRATGTFGLPASHVAWWAATNLLALEGLLFALNRCRRPNSEALRALMGEEDGADVASAKAMAAAGGGSGSGGSLAARGGSYGSTAARPATDL